MTVDELELLLALTREIGVVRHEQENRPELRVQLESDLDALAAQAPHIADPRGEVDATAFYLSYHGVPNRAFNEKLARLYLAAHPQLAWSAAHCAKPRRTTDRLRVGRRGHAKRGARFARNAS